MFERFTEHARRALFFARYEASQLGSRSIEIEHLLLGLTRESRGPAGGMFAHAARVAVDVRAHVARRTAAADKTSPSIEIPFSSETKRAMQRAGEEADALAHSDIDVEHLLLGILREGASTAARALNAAGLTLDAARTETARRSSLHAAGRRLRQGADDEALEVRIAPTSRSLPEGTRSHRDPDRWAFEGFQFRPLLQAIFGIPAARIDLTGAPSNDGRYDASAALPAERGRDDLRAILRHALEAYFGVTIAIESRTADVYVVTAPDGLRAVPAPGVGGGMFGASFTIESEGRAPLATPGDSGGAQGRLPDRFSGRGSLSVLCDLLEEPLGRPVIDRTGIDGNYEFSFQSDATTLPEFLSALRDQLGIAVTPAVETVETLVVRGTAAAP
jgi:uncharacterized protein (TIGR03435 family)